MLNKLSILEVIKELIIFGTKDANVVNRCFFSFGVAFLGEKTI